MGLLEDVGGFVGNPIGQVGKWTGSRDLRDLGKTLAGADPANAFLNPNDPNMFKGIGDFFNPKPGAPTGIAPPDPTAAENQRLTEQKQQQARDFRSGIPQLEKGLGRQYALKSHNDLASQLAQIRRDSARRGIMNSGIRLGNESGAQANAAGNIAQMKTQVHGAALSQADQLDQDAINAGITQTQVAQQLQDNIYNQALKSLAAKNAAMAGIGSGVGGTIGAAEGSKVKTSNSPNSYSSMTSGNKNPYEI